ncbi:MAG: hypothetical protein PSX81_02600 [bacterium]|nr:hypothetical protein [bacterium]
MNKNKQKIETTVFINSSFMRSLMLALILMISLTAYSRSARPNINTFSDADKLILSAT